MLIQKGERKRKEAVSSTAHVFSYELVTKQCSGNNKSKDEIQEEDMTTVSESMLVKIRADQAGNAKPSVLEVENKTKGLGRKLFKPGENHKASKRLNKKG